MKLFDWLRKWFKKETVLDQQLEADKLVANLDRRQLIALHKHTYNHLLVDQFLVALYSSQTMPQGRDTEAKLDADLTLIEAIQRRLNTLAP